MLYEIFNLKRAVRGTKMAFLGNRENVMSNFLRYNNAVVMYKDFQYLKVKFMAAT